MCAATRRAPSSSPAATLGETAVTASAFAPSARCAIAATTEESTPPENATTTVPSGCTRASSSLLKESDPLCTVMGLAEGSGPHGLDRLTGGAGGALAVGVL